MRTGQYDVISASGDATLRLIAAGDVEPVNTGLIKNYPDVFDALKAQAVELGERRGLRHPARPRRQRAHVQQGPGEARARLVVGGLRRRQPVRRQGHALRLAHLHRGRRAVPDEHQARARHQEPLRPRREAGSRRRSTC
nr:hypothetical protein [Angustibacter aerolatus]